MPGQIGGISPIAGARVRSFTPQPRSNVVHVSPQPAPPARANVIHHYGPTPQHVIDPIGSARKAAKPFLTSPAPPQRLPERQTTITHPHGSVARAMTPQPQR